MIFVTVGTHWFDELVETVDVAVGRRAVRDAALLQIGYAGHYVPKHCRYLTGAPTLTPFYERCDLVVGHGGTGTTIEVLMMGKPLISVANPLMQDNHQQEFLGALEAEGWVSYCRDLKDLPSMINDRRGMRRAVGPGRRLADALGLEFAALPPKRHARLSWLDNLSQRAAAAFEVDPRRTDRRSVDGAAVWKLVRTPSGFAET